MRDDREKLHDILEAIDRIDRYAVQGRQAFEQDEAKATYSLWRDDEDYKIDWHLSSEEIMRFVGQVEDK